MSGGFRYRRFVDQETGEVLTGGEIYEAVSSEVNTQSRFEWLKLYPRLIPVLQQIINSKNFDIFAYILDKLIYSSNEFTSSKSEIAKVTGAGTTTVSRFFDKFQTYDLIRHIKRSTWMLNPRLINGGGKPMTNLLIVKYGKLPRAEKADERERNEREDEVSDLCRRLNELMKEGEPYDED